MPELPWSVKVLPLPFKLYAGTYCLLSLAAMLAFAFKHSQVELAGRAYWRFLLVPWKCVTFLLLSLSITLPAPYLDIDSWDMPVAAGQSLAAFLVAPWAVGVFYRSFKIRLRPLPLILAFWLPLLADTRIPVPIAGLVTDALVWVVIPVATGILLRSRWSAVPKFWDRTAIGFASLSIVFIILVVVAANRDKLAALGPSLALGMLALNLAGYAFAFGAGTLL